jgi:hypothetical protein
VQEVSLVVHLAGGSEGYPALLTYLEAAVLRANELFEKVGVRFSVQEKIEGEPKCEVVQSGAERDALAIYAPADGRIHVFLIPRLMDLETPTKDIAGRHWRYQGKDRSLRGRRFVMVAPGSARTDTLAHELGHFFGLPHHPRFDNLMKQLPRDEKPAFTMGQIQILRRGVSTFRGPSSSPASKKDRAAGPR